MLVNKYHPHSTDEEAKIASDLLKVKEEKKKMTFSLAHLPSPSALSSPSSSYCITLVVDLRFCQIRDVLS